MNHRTDFAHFAKGDTSQWIAEINWFSGSWADMVTISSFDSTLWKNYFLENENEEIQSIVFANVQKLISIKFSVEIYYMSHPRSTWFDTKSALAEGTVRISIQPVAGSIIVTAYKSTNLQFSMAIW